MTISKKENKYDCLIIGGGPAGLSAAIYLARFNRSTLVIDSEKGGRWQTHEINENYLGFPQGIHSEKLRQLGKEQAKRFGAKFATDLIDSLTETNGVFRAHGKKSDYLGKSVIIATGVADYFPPFDKEKVYLGRSLFWCITCDGHKTVNKRVVVLGNNDEAACTCCQFKIYTDKLIFLTNDQVGKAKINSEWLKRLRENKIEFLEGELDKVVGAEGMVEKIILKDGKEIKTDYIFSMQGSSPHSSLAKELGIIVNKENYICVDLEQRTNKPLVYAAGDVTRYFSHQIASAVHEGSMAAQAANYDLYDDFQKELKDKMS